LEGAERLQSELSGKFEIRIRKNFFRFSQKFVINILHSLAFPKIFNFLVTEKSRLQLEFDGLSQENATVSVPDETKPEVEVETYSRIGHIVPI
jgi:hypothetical protein